jgi:hypothetical protein
MAVFVPLTPVTTPVPATTVATLVGLLLHEPPPVKLVSVVVPPSHTCKVPVIGNGTGFTVATAVLKQPVPSVYVIVVVPLEIPVSTPVVTSIVPTAGVVLAHVPPGVVVVSVVVPFTHTCKEPPILAGNAYTVTVALDVHVVGRVYTIVAVPVPLTPVTTPVPAPTVATLALVLVQPPPGVVLASVVVCPTHVVSVPVTGAGLAFTVTVVVRTQPVPSVYVIVAVPGTMPITTPVVGPTVAISGALVVQVPPRGRQLSVVVNPSHTFGLPVMIPGNAYTVTVCALRQPVASV